MPVKGPTDLQLALTQIKGLDGVTHYLIMSTDGVPLKYYGWGEEYKKVVQVAALLLDFALKSKNYLPKLLEGNEMKNIRLRTKFQEILVAPGRNCILVVFQKNQTAISERSSMSKDQ